MSRLTKIMGKTKKSTVVHNVIRKVNSTGIHTNNFENFDMNKDYAVKVFDKRAINDNYKRKIVQTEIDIIATLEHENCPRFVSMKEDEITVTLFSQKKKGLFDNGISW